MQLVNSLESSRYCTVRKQVLKSHYLVSLKTLKFSWVSSPSHLVSCYIVLPLVMTSDKGKNKGKKIGLDL